MVDDRVMLVVALVAVGFLPCAHAYSSYPGVCPLCPGQCEAPGHNNPNPISSSGFSLLIEQNGQSGKITLQGNRRFKGFFLRFFDESTKSVIGKFVDPKPANTEPVAVCDTNVQPATLGHVSGFSFDITTSNMTIPFTLNAGVDTSKTRIGAFATLVFNQDEFTIITANRSELLTVTAACPTRTPGASVHPNVSPGGVIIGFSPLLIVAIVGALFNLPAMRSARAFIDKCVLGTKLAGPVWYTESPRAAGYWLRAAAVDVVPAAAGASLGELSGYALFFATQAVTLGLCYIKIRDNKEPDITIMPRALGRLLQIDLALSLYSPTRNSIWSALLGISFERCIKYHRIVARSTIILVLAHGSLWISKTSWSNVVTNSPNCTGYGNVWGFISGVLLLVVLITTWDLIRRNIYELFKMTHLLAPVALGFACAHAADTIWFLILPVALYFMDWGLRVSQWAAAAEVVCSEVISESVLKLEIRAPAAVAAIQAKGAAGLGSFIMIHCGAASPLPEDLHPFTVSGITGPDTLTVHMKRQGPGSWTDCMYKAASKGTALRVRLEGPYGHIGLHLPDYPTVVCVAGGIGITPTARLLGVIVDSEARARLLPLLRTLVVIWTVQAKRNLTWFDELLQRAAALHHDVESSTAAGAGAGAAGGGAGGGLHVHLHLHVTREEAPPTDLVPISGTIRPEGSRAPTLPIARGRPKIGDVMRELQTGLADSDRARPGRGVAVLACGPPLLQREAAVAAEAAGFSVHLETFHL